MADLVEILAWTTIAGLAMYLGGLLARIERIRLRWLEEGFRHAVTAFGGGILVSAVALALVPEGVKYVSPLVVAAAMMLGGLGISVSR